MRLPLALRGTRKYQRPLMRGRWLIGLALLLAPSSVSAQRLSYSSGQDYFADSIVRASEHGALGAGTSSPIIRANVGPSLRVEGGMERTIRVGEPVTLVAVAADDGVP